ncbi:MAG: hypothetical protein LUG13_00710 [Oscillospiraceae bacterium]|nr:hypothetical protein [Oscillospiraceae bacterium]
MNVYGGNHKYRLSGLLVCVLLCAALCAGCTGQPAVTQSSPSPSPSTEGLNFENEALGFGLVLPTSWERKYTVIADEGTTVEFYCNAVLLSSSMIGTEVDGGLLFWITRYDSGTAPEEYLMQSEHIILSTEAYDYMIYRPSDIQYVRDTSAGTEYLAMTQDVAAIEASIYPLD